MENKILSNSNLLKDRPFLHRIKGFRLLSLSLFVAFSSTATSMYSQNEKISLNKKNVQIEEVLSDIEKQTNYLFVYNDQVQVNKLVSIAAQSEATSKVLDKVFAGTGIGYQVQGSHIVLSKNDDPKSSSSTSKKTIKGSVTDASGEPLIGVAIMIKGTSKGVVTDFDGLYELEVSDGDILEYSYIGYASQAKPVKGLTTLDIIMGEDDVVLSDLVVTALGIKRESKALTYNVQAVDVDQITAVKDANFMNSLSGKIAGVNINQSSSGVGGSTRVVMRGTKSLFGENNALYVLDGIPLSSLRSRQTSNFMEQDVQGDSEGISNLNPDDIDNISVLTGAAAAALYGNRGSNGVVLITTKKGGSDKTRVVYSNNTTFSSPFVMPEFQNTYGRTGTSYYSWGAKLADQGLSSNYDPKDFFQTGVNTMNSVSLSTGSESHQIYASVGAVNAEGIVPNSDYTRYNFTLKSTSELIKDRLTLDLGVNYVQQKDQNAIGQGLYFNPLVAIYLFPPQDDINRYRAYQVWDSERNFQVQNWPEEYKGEALEGLKQNPFWTTYKNLFNNKRDRYFMTGALNYKVLDWLTLSGRTRVDKSNSIFERRLYASSDLLFAKSKAGHFSHYTLNNTNLYADFLLNADKQLTEDFRLTGNFGGSINDEKSEFEGYDGPLISAVDYFHVSNVNIDNKDRSSSHTRTNSLYATAQLGYKNFLYLDLTGRMDYFSTLKSRTHKSSTHVLYPSVGLSSVLTEFIPKNDILSFWKVRGSYSEVGNPPSPYLLDTYVTIENGSVNTDAYYPINELKVEKTKAFEIGSDFRMFDNKLNLAFTYYNSNTFNQLFVYNLKPSSGYTYAMQNAGKVNNWGIELSIGYGQKLGPVDWDINVAYTLNRNKIKELLPKEIIDPVTGDLMPAPTEFEVASAGTYKMILKEGGSMGDIYVTSLKRDHNGYVNVNPQTGRFEVDQDNFIKIGEATPKYNLGISNHFGWKGINLGFMIDARVGGVVVSSTQAMMDQYGVSKATADARDNGGVYINSGMVDTQTYYEIVAAGKNGAALSEYTYSATNVRLRELSLAYNLPKKWFNDRLDLTLSVIGRNLFMLYNKAPFDPELTASTGTYFQGYDYFMPPSQRTIGFGVKATF